jgi:hypothetical protein
MGLKKRKKMSEKDGEKEGKRRKKEWKEGKEKPSHLAVTGYRATERN